MDETNSRRFRALLAGFERNPVFTHMHPRDLFSRWLDAVWALLDLPISPQAYRSELDAFTFSQGQELGRLFNLYLETVEELPFTDILGPLFMRLDSRSARSGQYFTPAPVAEMMARMSFDGGLFRRTVREHGTFSVCDPAAGSGVMLLAFARIVHDDSGREGVSRLRLYGMDIDRRCVTMCRIQLRMNGLDGFGRMAASAACPATPTQGG